ncbi:hypothetical protein BH20ACT2_BH20ACT2_20770 [soil metagenome]
MPRLHDTTPTFETFARKAFLESPVSRERLWTEQYEAPLSEVFEAFYARSADQRGRSALVRELSDVRTRVSEAAPVVRAAIEEVEPRVRGLLGVADEPAPLHVLMVGPYSTNAIVGALGDDVAVFHCLEWYHPDQATAVLVAHEDAHAWHEIARGGPGPEKDAAWVAFSEGLAIHAARQAAPDRPDDDYYWYGHGGFETWLPWCQEHRDDLLERFAADIDGPDAVETWFGSGLVDRHWRVGQFVADLLVGGLDRPLAELVKLEPAAAQATIRGALGR